MNIQAEKLSLIQWLASVTDASIIEKMKFLKDHATSTSTDWWDTISEAEKASIEQGVKDIIAGKVYSHDEIKKSYEKWL